MKNRRYTSTAILLSAVFFISVPIISNAYNFTKPLQLGSRGPEVSGLQTYLKQLGFFTYPQITGYFGQITEEAVKSFQRSKNIVSSGNPITTGYGKVGPLTRYFLNLENQSSQSVKTPSSTAPTASSHSGSSSHTTDDTPLLPPSSFLAQSQPDQVFLSWDAVPSALSYIIQRKDQNGQNLTSFSSNINSYTDTSVTEGFYTYSVLAVYAFGRSLPSQDLQVQIQRKQTGGGDPLAYYIDSVNGNDSNDGTSPSSPFKTISKLTSADAVSPRNIWKLAAGSHFREQLTVPRDNMTIEAYGTGDKPLLDASDPILTGSWTKTAGRTNVYQASVSHDAAIGKLFIGTWENGTHLIWVTSLAAVDSTPGSYWIGEFAGNDAPSPATLYVHTSDSADPATNGKLYEYGARKAGIDASYRSNITFESLWTRRNMHNDGSFLTGYKATVHNVLASDGSFHNIYVGFGSRLYNVIADGAYHPEGGNPFVWYGSANGEDIYFESCECRLPASQTGSGKFGCFGGHGSDSGRLGTISFVSCKTYNASPAYGSGLAQSLVIQGSEVHGASQWPIDGSDASNIHITGLVSDATGISGLFRILGSGASLEFDNSTIDLSDASNVNIIVLNSLNTGQIINIHDNTFIGTNWTTLLDGTTFARVSCLRNNMPGVWWLFRFDAVPPIWQSDYNIARTVSQVHVGATEWLWSDYKTATGQDAHSTP